MRISTATGLASLAMGTLAALASPAAAEPEYVEDLEDPGLAIAVDAEIFAGGAYEHTAADDATAFDLDRGEVGTRLAYGDDLTAELRLETVRPTPAPGTLDPEAGSLIVRAKRAWLSWRGHPHGPVRFELRGGLMPDAWIEAVESGYDLRALRATIGEATGLVEPSDLGLGGVMTSRFVRLEVAVTNGEGRAQMEQNDGKDVSGVLSFRMPRLGRNLSLAAHLYGRAGSVGADAARDHRLGMAVTVASPKYGGGTEWIDAWGAGDDPDVTGFVASWWAYGNVTRTSGVAGRVDLLSSRSTIDDRHGSEVVTTLALWRDLVPHGNASIRNFGVRAYLAAQLDRIPDLPATLPEASMVDATRVMLILSATAHEDI
ncbi:MAG: hypothetical protein H6708_26210 [Kofleriaceae bacterium]|nr:hypothetical protein [Kofleriaceae bacterium]